MGAACAAPPPCCGEVTEVCPNNSARLETEEALRAMQGMRLANGDIVLFHDPQQKQRDEVTIPEPIPGSAIPASDEDREEEEGCGEDLSPRTMSNSPICSPVEKVEDVDVQSETSSLAQPAGGGGDTAKAMHDVASTVYPESSLEAYPSSGDFASCDTGGSSFAGEEQHVGKEIGERSDGAARVSRFERATRVQKLRVFLATSGFRGVNAPKRSSSLVSRSFFYPLHAAVRANDVEAIHALLWAGGDRTKTDSHNLTPLALARKIDCNGSHGEAIRVLSS